MSCELKPIREQGYPPMAPQFPQPIFGTQAYDPRQATVSSERKWGQKFRAAVLAAALFLLLSYNGTYRMVDLVYNTITAKTNVIVSEGGCPTLMGAFVHATLFFLILFYLLWSI
jgi:hypothetical protein